MQMGDEIILIMPMKAVIIAGGRGTRLKGVTAEDMPKPLIPIAGKPVILTQIELLRRYGYNEILILTGFLSEKIENKIKDGSEFGVHIEYDREPYPLGTAGCIMQIEDKINGDFIVFNGDQVMDFNIPKMAEFHLRHKAAATLFLHPNDHPHDSDLVNIDDEGFVTHFYPKPHPQGVWYRNLVNAGAYIFSPRIFAYMKKGEKVDVGKNLLPRLISGHEKVAGYISAEYIKDMGTPERLEKVRNDVLSGKVAALNSSYKRPAIFLDRDGVINKEVDLLSRIDDLELLPGVHHAIKKINDSGYLCIVITNQPVIARNLLDFRELRDIHNKMEWLLGEHGCFIDALYFCPHHPHSGYPEERKEYKIDCDCRKPKPGMIFKAAEDYNIDLDNSFMIGDRETDIMAGHNAGIRTVIVKINGIHWETENSNAELRAENLNEAVDLIARQNRFYLREHEIYKR
jgi:D,D-heptose 1,7-bisphosphate phosphatase